MRIDARELNCKVIGEGGNLGLSQLGRIEFARRGGRLNTDFIDNSAGVNCFGRRGQFEDSPERRGARQGNHACGARSAAGADDG